jgi:RNA polymerase sigma-70 factor (ECF subfamily)
MLRMVESLAMPKSDDPATRSAADRDRLGRMFDAHYEVVWRTLRRRGLNPDTAGDVTQETFLIAAERLGDIHPQAERAFLISTALRAAHTFGRKTFRWQLDDSLHLRASGARDAGDARADVELCDLVLSKISPDLAEVFVLFEAEGLYSREIAGLLGIPRGSVRSRLRRAREQFRAVVSVIEQDMKREGHS